jgi:hypothetical protein
MAVDFFPPTNNLMGSAGERSDLISGRIIHEQNPPTAMATSSQTGVFLHYEGVI